MAHTTREQLGLPANRPIVLYVGRMARDKRIDVLLRAWPAIRAQTGAHLALALTDADSKP